MRDLTVWLCPSRHSLTSYGWRGDCASQQFTLWEEGKPAQEAWCSMARRTLPHGEKTLWFPKKEKFKDFKVLLWPPNSPHFNLNGHLQGFSCLKMGLCILTVHVTTTRSHMIKTRDTLFKCKSLHLPVFYNHMIHTVSMLLFDGLVRETLF